MLKLNSDKLSPVVLFSFIIGISLIILIFMGLGVDKSHEKSQKNGEVLHQTDDIEKKDIEALKAGEDVDNSIEPVVDGYKKFKKEDK